MVRDHFLSRGFSTFGEMLDTSEKPTTFLSLSSTILIFFASRVKEPRAFFPPLSFIEKSSFESTDKTLSLSIFIVPANSVFRLIVSLSNLVILPEIIDPSLIFIRSPYEKDGKNVIERKRNKFLIGK